MSNTITENPMLAKSLVNPDAKNGLADLMRAQQDLVSGQNRAPSQVESDDFNASSQGQMAAVRMASFEQAYQYSETMSLQMTTKEGDVVKVDFRQLYAEYQSFTHTQAATSGPSGVRQFESKEQLEATAFEESFAFSVEGDLNEAELNAIFNVFEQVDKLANNFFDGNIEKALAQANALNIDYGQLESFKLNLTQTESLSTSYQQAAVSEYEGVQNGQGGDGDEVYGVKMSDLPSYLQSWQSTIETLDAQFEASQKVFDEALADVTSQRFPELDSRMGWLERIQVFHESLSEYAAQSEAETGSEVESDIAPTASKVPVTEGETDVDKASETESVEEADKQLTEKSED
ncbi:MAG: hypothetical protein GXO35_01155 [Gammaproteobacteria bacterium]|nr:hypothetical protein [Gammaproteobacteria bacterium]